MNINRLLVDINRYLHNDEIIGIIQVGSSLMEYQDDMSDIDVEIIYNSDGTTPPPLVRTHEFDAQFIDMQTFALKAKSSDDIDHWPYENCRILYDTTETIKRAITLIARPPNDAEFRAKLAYFDYLNTVSRIEKSICRGQHLSLKVLIGFALEAIVRMVFYVNSRWPPPRHWIAENLDLLPDSDDISRAMSEIDLFTNLHNLDTLDRAVVRFLRAKSKFWYAQKLEIVRTYAERHSSLMDSDMLESNAVSELS